MADVHYRGRGGNRAVPFVERVMYTLETRCRGYDQSIQRTIWVVVAFIVWMVVADSLVSTQSVVYYGGTWNMVQTGTIDAQMSRAEERTMYRVLRTMEAHCALATEDVVLAPQVHVDNLPYMRSALRMCTRKLELVNPEIAVIGQHTGYCVDEHNGTTRRSHRQYPITVHSSSAPPVTFLDLAEVCTVTHAMSLLAGKW